ncbi:MAG: ribonuclease H-like domain-containing protein [Sandaracinus sp.]|nr:ribonuclease H-like domain-containing protein [Sandaracinus sp.]MCB9633731.1 ribonuclease H-like domain-containing protein [Sandaracinus sp.]
MPRLERTAGGILPGRREETPHGPLHRVHHLLEPNHHHGRVRAASALTVPTRIVADLALDRTFEDRDLRRILFLDTETTGLSTSSGTVAFLIGAAFFEDESLHVEQLLLTSYHEEAAMLRHLADRIRAADVVASYNGKSFDWPLLRTRFVMNRVPAPPLPPHLDLLHCSRRVFKRRLDSVRLVDMERELLGFVREHDVSGAEIPGIYHHFVRSGDPGRLDGVVEHNAHDLVALAAILGELGRRYDELRKEDEPEDHLGFAKVAERSGDPTRARRFAWAAADGGGDVDCTLEALLVAARVARREGDAAGELQALHRALEVRPGPEVHVLLAKHHEHRSKDLMRALLHASQSEEPVRWARLRARVARQNRRPKR